MSRVLVACEYSGRVREAFRKLGHDAWSCDLLPAEDESEFHEQCDVGDILFDKWDLVIAHPPCTYLCNSGVRWLKTEEGRWQQMEMACRFFKMFLELPRVCIENPIMHGHAKKLIGVQQSQVIQPWQFGHGETKATCLWLKDLPKLVPTNIVEGREGRVHAMPPGPDRWKERSRTYQGIANAMAEQWGPWL